MSTLNTAQRNAGRDAMNGIFELGAGTDAYLRIRNAADATLVEVTLDQTAVMGATAAGVSTMEPPNGEVSWVDYSSAPVLAGTADHAIITDRDGNEVERLTVGVGTGEVQLGNLSIQLGVNVVFSAAPFVTQQATYP